MNRRCEIVGCRAEADLTYLGHDVCSPHWNALTNENAPPDALRMALGIEVGHGTSMEEVMPKQKAVPAIEAKVQETEGNVGTAEPGPPAKRPRTVKTKTVEAKPKPAKNGKQKETEQNLVVFAFRLSHEERDLIHQAAGPGGASRFVRTIAVAAANEDEAAIRQTIMEARELR